MHNLKGVIEGCRCLAQETKFVRYETTHINGIYVFEGCFKAVLVDVDLQYRKSTSFPSLDTISLSTCFFGKFIFPTAYW